MDPIMTPSKDITWVNYSDLSGDGERERERDSDFTG